MNDERRKGRDICASTVDAHQGLDLSRRLVLWGWFSVVPSARAFARGASAFGEVHIAFAAAASANNHGSLAYRRQARLAVVPRTTPSPLCCLQHPRNDLLLHVVALQRRAAFSASRQRRRSWLVAACLSAGALLVALDEPLRKRLSRRGVHESLSGRFVVRLRVESGQDGHLHGLARLRVVRRARR